ncbi:MAG: DUF1848 domain-containing protein [Rectinemataceae bacterium]
MFLSVSRRTDIPALYGEWIANRFREGFVCVRNPFAVHRVSKVLLAPDKIDGIVFWTKNAIGFARYLDCFSEYPFYFQYTINPYGNDIERLPGPKENIIDNFIELSGRLGKSRMLWRYDPILCSDAISTEYHAQWFERLCQKLSSHAGKCIISFIDPYKKIERQMETNSIKVPDRQQMTELARLISGIAGKYGIIVETCCENADLADCGIAPGRCIDDALFSSITGFKYKAGKDRNQRKECACVESIDVGQYDTCTNGCIYCYASSNRKIARLNTSRHNPKSPLLVGELEEDDIVTERTVESAKLERDSSGR